MFIVSCFTAASVTKKSMCLLLENLILVDGLYKATFFWTQTEFLFKNNQKSIIYVYVISDCKSQGCPTKRQVTKNKDEKSVHPNESVESPCFGSSVHYGGRDFYMSSLSMQTTETSESVRDTSLHVA